MIHWAVCNRLAFSSELRGNPIRSLKWFLDEESDSFYQLINHTYHNVKMKVFQHLRKDEIRLRLFSRKQILEDICHRFRGFKEFRHGTQMDTIDLILVHYNFNSLGHWCVWKDDFDKTIQRLIEEEYSDRLYCTGCGKKSIIHRSRNGKIYEKCPLGKCRFFHDIKKPFASV